MHSQFDLRFAREHVGNGRCGEIWDLLEEQPWGRKICVIDGPWSMSIEFTPSSVYGPPAEADQSLIIYAAFLIAERIRRGEEVTCFVSFAAEELPYSPSAIRDMIDRLTALVIKREVENGWVCQEDHIRLVSSASLKQGVMTLELSEWLVHAIECDNSRPDSATENKDVAPRSLGFRRERLRRASPVPKLGRRA